MRCIKGGAGLLAGVFVLSIACLGAHATTITLDVSTETPTAGTWADHELVEIIVTAASNGDPGQGFAGADFLAGDFRITVDENLLKIHDVLSDDPFDEPDEGLLQVDVEGTANYHDALDPLYSKAEDTWIYDEFSDLTGDVIMAAGSYKAAPSAPPGGDQSLGVGTPVEFLHLVLEIQPGLGIDESAAVTFYGMVVAFNTAQQDTVANVFGTIPEPQNAIGSGSFELTRLPEPTSALMLLAGAGVLLRRRRGG